MITLRTERMSDFFTKYHIDGLPCAVVLHHFTAPDLCDPHDHPWSFTSHILHGWYEEEVFGTDGSTIICRDQGSVFDIPASHVHRIVEISEGGVWTLIIPGLHERTPGFYRFENGRVMYRRWNEREFRAL